MATPTDALAALQPPLRDLVLGAVKQGDEGAEHFGRTEVDKAAVAEWIQKSTSGQVGKSEELSLAALDKALLTRTYVVSNYFSAADVALYGALQPAFAQLQPAQYYSHPALTRYFDHIQSLPGVRKSAEALGASFSVVPIDVENMPTVERKVEVKKKEKKEKAPAAASDANPSASEATLVEGAAAVPEKAVKATPTQSDAPKKEKKEKKEKKDGAAAAETSKKGGGGGGKGAAAPAEDAGDPVPSMIDLRVGHIVDVMKHPDADGLYVEQIDFGEETGPRTVVSGLVNYIPIEQMRDKYLVGVCNLKPANMRGVKSFAMVLCATSKEGKEGGIELIQPPPGSKPGERVYFEGEKYESATALSQMNPKKKVFETIQPGFITLDSREAAWVDPASKSVHRIRTKDGVCLAPTLVGASLS